MWHVPAKYLCLQQKSHCTHAQAYRCPRSSPASDYSKQGDTPSARLSKLGCGPYRRQQHASSMTFAKKSPDSELPVFHKPKYIENGDPLQDEERLLQGLPIVEPGDESSNTIRKVPSDQALMPLRWGSSRRATGRSKSGLQVSSSYSLLLACNCHSVSKQCRLTPET